MLCGIDFSQDSRTALQYAAAVGSRGGGRVSAIFVDDPLLERAAAVQFDEQIAEKTARELQKFIASAVGAEAASRVTPVLSSGEPADEIQKAAKRLGADLIVLGTRGLGGAGKLFFGSTTSRVLRTARCPVLAVPASRSRKKAVAADWPTHMLAAIKVGEQSALDGKAAADVAAWFRAALTFVTVVEPAQSPLWLLRGRRADDRRRLLSAKARLSETAAKLGLKKTNVRALFGNPAEQIVAAAVDCGSDLIVLRLRAESGLLGSRQGSVTYRVLSTTKLPVLALSERAKPVRARHLQPDEWYNFE
jgi:nucleotide-binding universal stress UspA family protein